MQYTITSNPDIVNYEYSGFSKNDYLLDISHSNNINVGISGAYSYFSGHLSSTFGSEASETVLNTKNHYFYTNSILLKTNRVFVNNAASLIQNAPLSQSLINELFF